MGPHAVVCVSSHVRFLPAYWAASRAASTAICFTTSTAVLMAVLHVSIKKISALQRWQWLIYWWCRFGSGKGILLSSSRGENTGICSGRKNGT